jgi:phage gp36-like protein
MYIEVNDLLSPIGFFTSTQLAQYSSNDGETVEIHTERIEQIITQRSEEIDSYLRGRYELPIPVDNRAILKDICKNLVSYDLVSSRLGDRVSERNKGWEARAYSLLDKLQTGAIIIVDENINDIRFIVNARERLLDSTNF